MIDLNINYIKEKILNEDIYYSFILNKTRELGITSKKAFANLYDYLTDKINKTLYYQIEDYISCNIVFFYRENRHLFKNTFINYYIKNSNKKLSTDNVFKLNSYFPELN